VLPERALSD